MVKFTIPGKLPSLNEYAKASSFYAAANLKKRTEKHICKHIKKDLGETKVNKPANFIFYWIERNKRRDKDNIAAAKKFIFDSLVKTGVIVDDHWDIVLRFTDKFLLDEQNPRVEVEIDAEEG